MGMSTLITDEPGVVHASIVEAIVDIDCDLPPATNVLDLEDRARERLWVDYPEVRRVTDGVIALQFVTADGKQIVQFRPGGYSFNLLERYEGADGHLPEIDRTWRIFRDLAAPVQIRAVTLRRIHRFFFIAATGTFDRLRSVSESHGTPHFDPFLNYYSNIDAATGYRVSATLVVQPPDSDRLSVIADVETSDPSMRAVEDWRGVEEAILALDRLTNRVFEEVVNRTWLNLL